MCKKIILIGAGGHGKVIADIIEKSGDKLIGFLDDKAQCDNVMGYPILGKIDNCTNYSDCEFLISIGNNAVRKKIAEKYTYLKYYTAIHPNAVIANSAKIECGSCVMANAVINAAARIGKHCIVNTCASIDHDCAIANYVHISPNAVLCGNVNVGEQTHIGAGVVVKNNITIGEKITVGVGAAVVKDLKNSGVYVGIPARENV